MNSYLYEERFDEISELAYEALGAAGALSKLPVDALVDCCVFAGIDKLLIAWIRGRLESEDLDARLGGKTIPEICTLRRKMHFGKRFRSEYFILENAFYIMAPGLYAPVTGIENIVRQYTAQDYLIDRRYRYFYLYFDRLESSALNDEQVRRLLAACHGTEIYVPVLLAVTLGLRRGEALGLQWQDIDLQHGVLSVRRSASYRDGGMVTGATKTRSSRRTLLLPSGVTGELREISVSGHQMSVNGKKTDIGREDLLAAGKVAGLSARTCLGIIDRVQAAVRDWTRFAAKAEAPEWAWSWSGTAETAGGSCG